MGGAKIWDSVPGGDFDEEHDLKDLPSWFLDGTHPVPAWEPFMGWLWCRPLMGAMKCSSLKACIPTCIAWEVHLYKGRNYISIAIVRDPEEIKRREVKFKEAMRPYIEDFDGWWNSAKDELMTAFDRIKSVDVDTVPLNELYHHFRDCLDTYSKMWELHFDGMYGAYNTWVLLENLCKERFGITDQSPEFQKMMIGFDTKIFQVDKRMWQLGQDAIKKGLADIFMTTESREVIPQLEQAETGREWLKELREFLNEDGWRMERLASVSDPTWIEDPTPAIANIKGFIAKGGSFALDETRKRLAKEREEAVAAMLKRVPEDEKEWFRALIRSAQRAGSYSEEHTYYCEYYSHALIRRCLLAIGRRFVQAGSFDRVDDIFFLNPEEIDSFMHIPEVHDLRWIVNRRRQEWEEWKNEEVPPVFTVRGSFEEAVGMDLLPSMDPIAIKTVLGEMPEVRPELKADIYGLRGAPGVAEGTARVIASLEQVHEIQPGDILVAPTTSTSWTPAFHLVAGMVIDHGGTLGHSAIVARELAIPAVVNTFVGTSKIKTGQRIRVNGDEGTVYILES
jgi:pyruvate,water dikinase